MPFTKDMENLLRKFRRSAGDYAEGTKKAFKIAFDKDMTITRKRKKNKKWKYQKTNKKNKCYNNKGLY